MAIISNIKAQETEWERNDRLNRSYGNWIKAQLKSSTFAYKVERDYKNLSGTIFKVRSEKENLENFLYELPEAMKIPDEFLDDYVLDMAEVDGKIVCLENSIRAGSVSLVSSHRLDRKQNGPWAGSKSHYEIALRIPGISYASVDETVSGIYKSMKEADHIIEEKNKHN